MLCAMTDALLCSLEGACVARSLSYVAGKSFLSAALLSCCPESLLSMLELPGFNSYLDWLLLSPLALIQMPCTLYMCPQINGSRSVAEADGLALSHSGQPCTAGWAS